MADWKAAAAATLDTTRLWYFEFADAILDRNKSWSEVWISTWDRTEDLERDMLHGWQQAGVRHPLMALTVMSRMSGALYFVTLLRWPGPALRFTLIAVLLPTFWAMGSLIVRRQARVPRKLHALSGIEEPHHHPLTG